MSFPNKTMKKFLSSILAIVMCASMAQAQTAEVSVSLNEQFFDALLDAIFKNFNAPEFPLAKNDAKFQMPEAAAKNLNFRVLPVKYEKTRLDFAANQAAVPAACSESIRLLREVNDVRTAVRFREGKIYAPIAFSGSYNPPLIGCVDFQGWAETNIDLEYDRQNRKLVGRVRVLSVNLGGAANLASGVLSRLVQSSIDKKINPIEILQIDKLSFVVPVQNAGGSLKMKATAVRHEITNGSLNVSIAYEFQK